MNKAIYELLKKAPKGVLKVIAEKPELVLGVTSMLAACITSKVKSWGIQEGHISTIKRFNNYGSFNGGRTQYLEECDNDTLVRDEKHPEFRTKVEEGVRRNELEMNHKKFKKGVN